MSVVDKFDHDWHQYKTLFCTADLNNKTTDDLYRWLGWFIIVLTKEIISEIDAKVLLSTH